MSSASILLLRHSPAGKRREWQADDTLRPLDQQGRRQAAALADSLAGYPITRICSSPYKRCLQTVEPLSRKLGVPVEVVPQLGEGASTEDVVDFLESASGSLTVACTHGDVMEMLVGAGKPMKKGAFWLLDSDLRPVEYKMVV